MRRRILTAILAITALSILLFGVPLAIVVERFVDQDATLRLERQAILASRDVPADFSTSNDPVELPGGESGASLALYGRDGKRVVGDGPLTADSVTVDALANRVSDTEIGDARVVAVPVNANEQVIGAIRAEQPTSASDARAWRIGGLLAALAAAVFAVGAAVAVVVARRLARPVRRLADATVALGAGTFDLVVIPTGIAELDAAGNSLTTTAQRLDAALQRERSFSADASHQLRTPLAGLRAAIETELQFPRPDPTVVLTEALDDIDRLERTIAELLSIARAQQKPDQHVDLEAVLAQTREHWHGRLAALGRPLRIESADVSPVLGNPVLLRHALDVVLDNAVVHGAGAVTITVETGPTSAKISINDEGPGFDGTSRQAEPSDSSYDHGHGLELAERLLASMTARLVIARRGPSPIINIALPVVPTTPESGETP